MSSAESSHTRRTSTPPPEPAVSNPSGFKYRLDLPLDDRPECVRRLKDFIQNKQNHIRERHSQGAGGLDIANDLARLGDQVIRNALSLVFRNYVSLNDLEEIDTDSDDLHLALVALGGYGRRDVCPKSDLDFMILYEGELDELVRRVNSGVLQLLWDLKFEVGHGIRTAGEAIEDAASDTTIMTSLLESRRIAGSRRVYHDFITRLIEKVQADDGTDFFRAKQEERRIRYRDFGGDIYEVEPNVKESAGGIRDFNEAMWLAGVKYNIRNLQDLHALGILDEGDFLLIIRALDFMLRVRNEIHFRYDMKDDQLTFRRQGPVARALGYGDEKHSRAIERFLEDYYAHAKILHDFLDRITTLWRISFVRKTRDESTISVEHLDRGLQLVDGQIQVPMEDGDWFRENPSRLLELLWYWQKSGNPLSASSERLMRRNLNLIDDGFRRSSVATNFFLAICKRLSHTGRTLRKMDSLGMLERFLPEFTEIKGIIRYQLFHHYPVHEHTIRALESLGQIEQLGTAGAEFLREALHEVKKPELVTLAVLLHDIGKGREGSHVEWGLQITREVCERLDLEDEDTAEVEFLVANHLRMSHLSQYRDIYDTDIIEDFAMEVENVDRLRMLYLLTYADISAVGPNVWNDWKSALLAQLYVKTDKHLSRGGLETRTEEYWKGEKTERVLEYLQDLSAEQVEKHIREMSERYVAVNNARDIARHIELTAEYGESGGDEDEIWLESMRWRPKSLSTTRVVICTEDRPGLFSTITGVLASHGLNIAQADLFTREDGCVFDTFDILDFHVFDGKENDESVTGRKWRRVEDSLRNALEGKVETAHLVKQARKHFSVRMRGEAEVPVRVNFDNDSSRTHTVIDIQSSDRLGLLYDLTTTMTDLGLDIAMARITTDARKVIDSFYVTQNNLKMPESDLPAIRESLVISIEGIAAANELSSGESR